MSDIVEQVEIFVTEELTKKLDPKFLYHTLEHTQQVVESSKELIEASGLSTEEANEVLTAAWLHDVGFVVGVEDHEVKGCKIAQDFLKKNHCKEGFIKNVCSLIMATMAKHEPKNIKEEIIRDADASHFATGNFLTITELLRQELDNFGEAYSVNEWRKLNVRLLRADHRYFTDYAKENWSAGKKKNLGKLVKAKKKSKKLVRKEKLKAEFKGKLPDRGVQTLYRVTLRNHIKLSDIADTKANILLSVNAIIISLALANLIPKLDNPSNEYLFYPTFTFILFSIISMILSIMATRPNITSGEFTNEDVKSKKVNLLFFGNFHKMQLDRYEWAMTELIKDKDYIYSSLTKDLYFLGVVLQRKYKLLRITYTIFMLGMIISVIAFIVALKFFGPDRMLEMPVLPS